jgi:hypothetical protein
MVNLKANQLVMKNAKTNMMKQSSGITHSKDNHSSSKLVQDHKISNLTIFHQNIRGIRNKIDEFLISLSANEPQIICLLEHHLKTEEIDKLNVYQYTIGTSFCRQHYSCGEVCIMVHKNIQFIPINLNLFNKEKDLEISALKLHFMSNLFIVACIYRSPMGDFYYF